MTQGNFFDQCHRCSYLGYLHSLVDSRNDRMSASVQAWLFVIVIILMGVEL